MNTRRDIASKTGDVDIELHRAGAGAALSKIALTPKIRIAKGVAFYSCGRTLAARLVANLSDRRFLAGELNTVIRPSDTARLSRYKILINQTLGLQLPSDAARPAVSVRHRGSGHKAASFSRRSR